MKEEGRISMKAAAERVPEYMKAYKLADEADECPFL
jgi:hypothetical protein